VITVSAQSAPPQTRSARLGSMRAHEFSLTQGGLFAGGPDNDSYMLVGAEDAPRCPRCGFALDQAWINPRFTLTEKQSARDVQVESERLFEGGLGRISLPALARRRRELWSTKSWANLNDPLSRLLHAEE
jgi:hypothetical protein